MKTSHLKYSIYTVLTMVLYMQSFSVLRAQDNSSSIDMARASVLALINHQNSSLFNGNKHVRVFRNNLPSGFAFEYEWPLGFSVSEYIPSRRKSKFPIYAFGPMVIRGSQCEWILSEVSFPRKRKTSQHWIEVHEWYFFQFSMNCETKKWQLTEFTPSIMFNKKSKTDPLDLGLPIGNYWDKPQTHK